MVLYNIHSDVLEKTYRAHICSFATLFCIGIGVLTYVTPLFIAHQSIGLWLQEDYFREQPEVNYKHDFILLVQGKDPNSILGYSTYRKFNDFLGESVRIPTVTSTEFDRNHDGKMDYLSLKVRLPLSDTEIIHKVQLLLFFDYQLHKFPSVQMESLANIHYDSSLPASEFITEGYLKFNQKHSLPNKGSYTKFNVPIINTTSDNLQSWDLQSIMAAYQSRNISTDFIGRYPVWKSGETFGQPFIIKVKIFYREELIMYRPGFFQLIKFAWIQYLAILLIFFVVLGQVKKIVYNNRLVRVYKPKVCVD